MKVGKISDFCSTLWRNKGGVSLRSYVEGDNGMKKRVEEVHRLYNLGEGILFWWVILRGVSHRS